MLTNHIDIFTTGKGADDSFGGRDVLMMFASRRHTTSSSWAAGCYPPLGPRLRGSLHIGVWGSCHAFGPQRVSSTPKPARDHRLGCGQDDSEVLWPTGTSMYVSWSQDFCYISSSSIISLLSRSPPSRQFPWVSMSSATDQSPLSNFFSCQVELE